MNTQNISQPKADPKALKWLKTKLAEVHGQCSRSTLYRLSKQGLLRTSSIGGITLWSKDDLDAIIEANAEIQCSSCGDLVHPNRINGSNDDRGRMNREPVCENCITGQARKGEL